MRKSIVALLILSSAAAAQRFPRLHRNRVDAERAALHEKMTRLAETRKSLGMPEVQPAPKELLAFNDVQKVHAAPAARQRAIPKAERSRTSVPGAAQANAPNNGVPQEVNGNQEVSLGEVARQYRAKKRAAKADGN